MQSLLRRLRRCVPLHLFIICLAVYCLTAGVSLSRHSLAPHFVYLADSLLQGRLDLVHIPQPPYDLTPFRGRWYVSFPPLPALLMLPLVALRGLNVSDVAFSVLWGALNVPLFYAVLRRTQRHLEIRNEGRDRRAGIWLCLLLGFGTPLWYCAALGSVWYTAHVVAITCLCLYVLEAMGKNRPGLAGLWLGLGFLARPPVLFAFPLSLWLGRCKAQQVRGTARFLLLFALGMAPALAGQAAYNWVRFESPLEFGYRWMNSPPSLLERQETWGQFSVHFLPENLYTLLVRPPLLSLSPSRSLHIEPNPWGMGLLFTCPALLLALPLKSIARHVRRLHLPDISHPSESCIFIVRRRSLRLALWLSIALVQLPSLLYFNTGSYQFGYRFALDWMPLGVLLIALEIEYRPSQWAKMLMVTSILMHLWGLLWMYPNFNGQPWHLQYVSLLHGVMKCPLPPMLAFRRPASDLPRPVLP